MSHQATEAQREWLQSLYRAAGHPASVVDQIATMEMTREQASAAKQWNYICSLAKDHLPGATWDNVDVEIEKRYNVLYTTLTKQKASGLIDILKTQAW